MRVRVAKASMKKIPMTNNKRKRKLGKTHPLVLTLRTRGFTVREAHRAANAFFAAIKAAVLRREDVELPIGVLKVVAHTHKPYRKWRWGQPIQFYRKRYQIVLKQK